MRIVEIGVGGFKNIESVTLKFTQQISALIGFNNYGKSNALQGIFFGLQFIKATPEKRSSMLQTTMFRPLLNSLTHKPYSFSLKVDDNGVRWCYAFNWNWDDKDHNQISIIEEVLTKNEEVLFKRKTNKVQLANDKEHIHIGDLDLALDILGDNYDSIASKLKSFGVYQVDLLGSTDAQRILLGSERVVIGEAVAYLQNHHANDYALLHDAYSALLPEIEWIKAVDIDGKWQLQFKEHYIDQPMPFEYLSTGSKRLFMLLFMAINAKHYGIKLLILEEIETCIHPRLIPLLLMALKRIVGDCQTVLTSHSPYLIEHLSLNNIYLAIPPIQGVAGFKRINPMLHKKLMNQAQELDISLGVYLFDLLIESLYEPQMLWEWLE